MKNFIIFILLFPLTFLGQNKASTISKDSLIKNLSKTFYQASYKNPDSALLLLKNALPNYNKDPLIQSWKNHLKGSYYYSRQNGDSALYYLDKVISTIKPEDDAYLYNESLILTAMVYKNTGKQELAYEKLKEAESILNKNLSAKSDSKINIYRALGAYYTDLPNYDKAISYFLKALKLLENNEKQKRNLANVNINLAEIFVQLLDFEKAKNYLETAKNICEDIAFEMGIHTCNLKLAEVAIKTEIVENFDIQNLENSIIFFEKGNLYPLEVEGYFYLGQIQNKKGNLTASKEAFLRALELSRNINYSQGIINSLRNLGLLEEDLNKNQTALKYYKEGYNISISNSILETQKLLATNLYLLYDKIGNTDSAYLYLKKVTVLKDSLDIAEQIKNTQELETRYQSEKKESEIALLTTQKKLAEKEKSNQRNVLLGFLGLMLLIATTLFIILRNRQLTNIKLRELDKAKSTFFANISHEFRTPLSLIKGPIEDQLYNKKLLPNQRKNLLLAQRNAQRLENLVEQLLALSKLESGKINLQIQPGNLSKFLKLLIEAFDFRFIEKHITYRINIPNYNTVDWFDWDILEKAVGNIITNAIKYCPENGVINIQANQNDSVFTFSISNSGNYLNSAEQKKIFERFYQTNPENPGTGIGLALTKELIQLHHGTISVSSEVNGLTTFTIKIPISKSEYSISEIISEDINIDRTNYIYEENFTVSNEFAPEDSLTILILDDSLEIRNYVSSIFENTYKVLTTNNGKNGLDIAIETIPDIVISDIMMPVKDGFTFTKNLKEHPLTSHIPIILLSAKNLVDDKLEGMEVGADAYLTKPFSSQLLRATVENLIENRRKLQQRFSQEVFLLPKDMAISSSDEKFLENLQKVLDNKLTSSNFSAESFSNEMNVSRMQLHRKLKALTGQSTTEFIRGQRLKLAAKLMRENKISISEIGYTVGFNDPSYFTRCFKNEYGVSPSEFYSK
jgi:signal transduction histidine kinase/DNA-binding response OmpR family regulator/Flp pilus assembly protein TadD